MSETVSNPGDERRIAFVQSSWHPEIIGQCRTAFVEALLALGYEPGQIEIFDVPGVFEAPLQAKLLAASGRYTAIVAAGLLADGGIHRQDFVAEAVIHGLMDVQLDMQIPVINAVIMPQNFHEHEEHRRFFGDFFAQKGAEAAAACHPSMDNVAKVLRTGARAKSRPA